MFKAVLFSLFLVPSVAFSDHENVDVSVMNTHCDGAQNIVMDNVTGFERDENHQYFRIEASLLASGCTPTWLADIREESQLTYGFIPAKLSRSEKIVCSRPSPYTDDLFRRKHVKTKIVVFPHLQSLTRTFVNEQVTYLGLCGD